MPAKVAEKIDCLRDNQINLPPEIFEDLLPDEDYEYQFEAISESDSPIDTFKKETDNLRQLNDIDAGSASLNAILKRQIFIGLIGSMETYLSDNFIRLTTSNPDYLKKFVETYPEFKKRNFTLDEVFKKHNIIGETAKTVMLEVIYHNLVTVRMMYTVTFGIGFPELKIPLEYVRTRHDLVHRNGKTKTGEVVELDHATVDKAINDIDAFINAILDHFTLKETTDQIDKPN